jgi:hypothetical protein
MYDPNQPRIPKRHHGGGRWTRGGYGRLSDVGMLLPPQQDEDNAQPTLADLPHYAWLQDPLQRERPTYDFNSAGGQFPTLDPATAGATAVTGWGALNWFRDGISEEEARGWDEYERLSDENSPERRAAIIYKVGQFRRGRADVLEFEGVERLTGEQLKKLCPRIESVQGLLNEAARITREEGKYKGPQSFGNEVHRNLQILIEGNRTRNLALDSERSFLIDRYRDVPRGKKGSVRPDVKEKEKVETDDDGDETLCFYDGKTGGARLDPRYMRKIANYMLKTRPAKRVIVTEVRPEE